MPERLLSGNRKWVSRMREEDPQFFSQLEEGQHPGYLWIGCSDSRVPATNITDTMPGSIFVHRNIANLVVDGDMNLQSVVYFALKNLGVEHIIVCGHYGCGGVKAALKDEWLGYLEGWIGHIRMVRERHREELDAIADSTQRERRLCELNVIAQVRNLARIPFVHDHWADGEKPHLRGWIYDVGKGLLEELDVFYSGERRPEAFGLSGNGEK